MSPFCLRARLQHRAALPAHTHGEMKGEGAHPATESSSTMVGKDAVNSSLQRTRALAGWLENSQDGPSSIHCGGAGAESRESQAGEEGESEDHHAPSSVSCLCTGTPQGFSESQSALAGLYYQVSQIPNQVNSVFQGVQDGGES